MNKTFFTALSREEKKKSSKKLYNFWLRFSVALLDIIEKENRKIDLLQVSTSEDSGQCVFQYGGWMELKDALELSIFIVRF